MRIYLAARYSRRLELCDYRSQLEQLGHVVTSRWLNGTHQIDNAGNPLADDGEPLIDGDDDSTAVKNAELRSQFAKEDFSDVITSDLLIAFTEEPRSGHSRGGRHVEMGLALGHGVGVWIVGHRENIFCWHEAVKFFRTWAECVDELRPVTV